MGEDAWAEYQKDRIKKKSDAQTLKDRNSRKVMRYRRAMKARLIEYKGGKCQLCGYNKPFPSAYHFHHRDPLTKSFNLSAKGCTLKFETLQKEADKCDLLCSNCHAELHDIQYQNNEYLKKDELINRNLRQPNQMEIRQCEFCNADFETKYPNKRYCNDLCRSRHRESVLRNLKQVKLDAIVSKKPEDYNPNWRNQPRPSTRKVIRPSHQELEDMLKTMSYCAVGRKYGVSDNAVRKWEKANHDFSSTNSKSDILESS